MLPKDEEVIYQNGQKNIKEMCGFFEPTRERGEILKT
jgi:hypothetical protein